MRSLNRKQKRHAAVAVEAALVYPVMIFLFLGLIIGGVGVFRYQQVACLSREAARWASVRGEDYQRTTDLPFPTQQQIYDQAVLPMAAGMDPALVTVQVEWVDQSTGTAYAWDAASKSVLSINSSGEYVTNTVRVTVSYQWTPNFLGIGTRYMRSISEIPMSY